MNNQIIKPSCCVLPQHPFNMGDSVVQLASKGHHDNILSSLHQLRLGGQLVDITVQVDHQGEMEEFQAHQVMLAAYSGYFKRLLLSQDSVPDKLFLSNIRTANFSKFLEFVYTGKVEVAQDKLGDVQAAAVLLDCKDLSEVCGKAMTAGVCSPSSDASAGLDSAAEQKPPDTSAIKQPKQASKRKLPLKSTKRDAGTQQPTKKPAKVKDPVGDEMEIVVPDDEGVRRVSIRLAGRKIPVGLLKHRDTTDEDPETTDLDSPSETEENRGAVEGAVEPSSPAAKDRKKGKPKDAESIVAVVVGDEENEGEEGHLVDDDPDLALYLSDEDEEDGGAEKRAKRTSKAQFQCGSCQRTFHYARSYVKHIRCVGRFFS